MSSNNSQRNIILAIAVIIAVMAGIIIFFEKGLVKQRIPENSIPSRPVLKWIDPELAIKGCLFELGIHKDSVEFNDSDIGVQIKEKISEGHLEKAFEPLNKIGKVEINDTGNVAIIIDGRTWKITFIHPEPTEPAKPGKPFIPGKKAKIAIIIDDMGQSTGVAQRLCSIDDNLTFSILPYNKYAKNVAALLHSKGCEVLMHLPMEGSKGNNPGPGAILSGMTDDEVLTNLKDNLKDVPYAVGVNNHMGSVITRDREKMDIIIHELDKRGLFFVDSVTAPGTICSDSAKDSGCPFAKRDVFLDNEPNQSYIKGQIENLKKVAIKNGYAIGICHPHDETIAALAKELPRLRDQGVEIVPVSRLIKKG